MIFPATHLGAATPCKRPSLNRPAIGLALGGGGARGSAHIGVIRLLEEMNIPVDYIAGTSIGALVGALYATGMTAAELEGVLLDIDWNDLFNDEAPRSEQPFRRKRDDNFALFGPKLGIGEKAALVPRGAISGQKINFLFETLVKQRTQLSDFEALPLPFQAVATDLVTGGQVVLDEGNLALAMRASMSVPGLFDPVEWAGYLLVDGGLVNNLPVDVAREMGADIVIAVNVGTSLTPREELTTALSVLNQLSNFMTYTNTARNLASLTDRDVLIAPPLGNQVTSGSFDRVSEGMAIGYEAAARVREALRPLALEEQHYRAYRSGIDQCVTPPQPVQFIQLENRSRFDDDVIRKRIRLEEGAPLDTDALEGTVRDIYALGFLESAGYQVVKESGRTGVLFEVQQDARGTQLIETGLDLSVDSEESSLNLRVGYLNTAIDGYGSELRLLTQWGEDPALLLDLYKYFDSRLQWAMVAQLYAERRDITEYDGDGNALFTSRVKQYGGLLGGGREFGRHALLAAGVRLFSGSADTQVGPPGMEEFDFDGGEYTLRGTYDRMDDRYFPGEGEYAQLTYLKADETLGADDEYEQFSLQVFKASTWDRHSLMGGARYFETVDGEAPPYALVRAGGFANLSGFQVEELAGQHYAMAIGDYRYHFAGSGLLPAYLGTTLEYGRVSDDAGDLFDNGILNGSLYFGYRSPIGPLYLGYGMAEGGRYAYFMRIGNVVGGGNSIVR